MSAVFGLYCDVGDAMAPSALSPTQTNLDELPSPSETAPSVPPRLHLAGSLCESSTEDLHALLDPHERRIRAAWLGARRKARQLRGLKGSSRPPSLKDLGRSPGDQFELEPEPPSPLLEEKSASCPLKARSILKKRSESREDPLSYWSPDGVESTPPGRLELARGDEPMRPSRSADAVVGVWAKRAAPVVPPPEPPARCAWSHWVCCSASPDGERGG